MFRLNRIERFTPRPVIIERFGNCADYYKSQFDCERDPDMNYAPRQGYCSQNAIACTDSNINKDPNILTACNTAGREMHNCQWDPEKNSCGCDPLIEPFATPCGQPGASCVDGPPPAGNCWGVNPLTGANRQCVAVGRGGAICACA